MVAFTIQRTYIIYNPLSFKFKSMKTAWYTVSSLVSVSLISNLWVVFSLDINEVFQSPPQQQQPKTKIKYCGVKAGLDTTYYHATFVYICLVMLLPMVIIFISNSVIIHRLTSKKKRLIVTQNFQKKRATSEKTTKPLPNVHVNKMTDSNLALISSGKIKPYYMNVNQVINKVTEKANCVTKITKMLMLVSFTNALLNLPYFAMWAWNYEHVDNPMTTRHQSGPSLRMYIFKLSELLYLTSFGISFYVYYASGTVFRRQVKYSCKLAKNKKFFFFPLIYLNFIISFALDFKSCLGNKTKRAFTSFGSSTMLTTTALTLNKQKELTKTSLDCIE